MAEPQKAALRCVSSQRRSLLYVLLDPQGALVGLESVQVDGAAVGPITHSPGPVVLGRGCAENGRVDDDGVRRHPVSAVMFAMAVAVRSIGWDFWWPGRDSAQLRRLKVYLPVGSFFIW
jgi:hypothetical protein